MNRTVTFISYISSLATLLLVIQCSTATTPTTPKPHSQASPSLAGSNQSNSAQESIDDILKDTLQLLNGLDRKLVQANNRTRNALMRDNLRSLEKQQQLQQQQQKSSTNERDGERLAEQQLTQLVEKFSSERQKVGQDSMSAQASSVSVNVDHQKSDAPEDGGESMEMFAQVLNPSMRKLRQLNSSSSSAIPLDNSDFTNRHIQFSLDLMQALFSASTQQQSEKPTNSKQKNGQSPASSNNLDSFLISPVSIQLVMMMMHLGARGQTKREIANCLHLPAPFEGPLLMSGSGSSRTIESAPQQNQHSTTVQSPPGNKLRRRNPSIQSQQQAAAASMAAQLPKRLSSVSTNQYSSSPTNNVHELFGSAMKNLFKDPAVVKALTSANQIFLQRELNLLAPYEQAVRHYYGVELKPVDFQQQAIINSSTTNANETTGYNFQEQPVHLLINDWIEKQTKGKISNFLQSPVPSSTLLMAINVLFFKGDWQYKFDPADTNPDGWFTLANGQTVKMPMMVNRLPLAHAYDAQMKTSVIELPYKAQRLGLFVLLPDEANGIYQTMRQLNSTSFANLISMMRKSSSSVAGANPVGDSSSNNGDNPLAGINVRIPKFSIESSPRLSQILSQKMGLKSLFSPDIADLSGIFGHQNPRRSTNSTASQASNNPQRVGLDELVHKAVLQVHEQGSVAAAASATIVERVGLFNGQYFEADHPFLIFLMDKQTGLVLFSGLFAGPANGSSMDNQPMSTANNSNNN